MIHAFNLRIALGIYPHRLPADCLRSGCDSVRSFVHCRYPPNDWSPIHRSPARSVVVRCKSGSDDHDLRDYLRASILVTETLAHHRMRTNGFDEESELVGFGSRHTEDLDIKRKSYPLPMKEPGHQKPYTLGAEFFRRFRSPTIFLRISCDKDFLLPVIVEEHAMEKLVSQLLEYDDGVMMDQYQLAHNVASVFGFKAAMVKITEKLYSSYVARLYFCKHGESEVVDVDIRPSDGIIVANIFKAPIYVRKDIVLTDAIVASSGCGRSRDSKPAYDVFLDSACEGLDLVTEELNLVRNMIQAAKEERFKDAAAWRCKLTDFRNSRI